MRYIFLGAALLIAFDMWAGFELGSHVGAVISAPMATINEALEHVR